VKYRTLKPGEIVRLGDEATAALNRRGMGWLSADRIAGARVREFDYLRFRRPVKGGRK
jgi:hypothetical protein